MHSSYVGRTHFGGNIANRYYLDKEKFILEILHGVQDPLENRDWLGIGKNLILNETNYLSFNPEMHEFLQDFHDGHLIPRNEIFNPFQPDQYRQTRGLFYFLYNTNDWETLRTNACWARRRIHPEMFVFAFTQALLKRIDLKGLILPKIYEIFPEYFLAANDVRISLKFDYSQWTRLGNYYGTSHNQSIVHSNWQKGAQPKDVMGVRGTEKWAQAMGDVTALWFSEKTNRNNDISYSYLTNDLDWNTYWYYQNMGFWWNDIDNAGSEREEGSLWELWFGNLQRILARYKLESYAMNFWAGQFHERFDLVEIPSENTEVLDGLVARVERIVNAQSLIVAATGKVLSLQRGRNWLPLLNELFGHDLYEFYGKYFGLSRNQHRSTFRQSLLHFQTQLRDHQFYMYAEKLLNVYRRLYRAFQSSDLKKVKRPSLKINNVNITRLESFYEDIDIDVTNLLNPKHFYFAGQLMWSKSLQIRQQRLQHRPFTIKLNITSMMPQPIVLRTFLAPIDRSAIARNTDFFQLDTFFVYLLPGTNIVERMSSEFFDAQTKSHLSYTELYRLMLLALDDRYEFPLNLTNSDCAFPERLLLPHGGLHGEGLPVKFFFIATNYEYRFQAVGNFKCDFTDGITRFDELPINFPFDSEHDDIGDGDGDGDGFHGDHMFWKRAEIYHLD